MATFLAQVFKVYGAIRWSNVYRFEAANLAEATTDVVPLLATAEHALLHPDMSVESIRISSATTGDDVFSVTPINEPGGSAAADDPLPLFCTVRVDINVIGGGRPSRKYYRGNLTESVITGSTINDTTLTLFETTVNNLISDMNDAGHALEDPQQQDWDVASALRPIQMRQLHRKRRRTPAP
jgi:hypothetical protein